MEGYGNIGIWGLEGCGIDGCEIDGCGDGGIWEYRDVGVRGMCGIDGCGDEGMFHIRWCLFVDNKEKP